MMKKTDETRLFVVETSSGRWAKYAVVARNATEAKRLVEAGETQPFDVQESEGEESIVAVTEASASDDGERAEAWLREQKE